MALFQALKAERKKKRPAALEKEEGPKPLRLFHFSPEQPVLPISHHPEDSSLVAPAGVIIEDLGESLGVGAFWEIDVASFQVFAFE